MNELVIKLLFVLVAILLSVCCRLYSDKRYAEQQRDEARRALAATYGCLEREHLRNDWIEAELAEHGTPLTTLFRFFDGKEG